MVFQRADTLAAAMEARCYRGGRGRVRMFPLVWGSRENMAVVLFLAFAALALFVERVFG
jgi:energy-coupling factor transport system permease protein